ncbi:MAG: LemA family protein [Euryhalocaulis sp.]|uniref:LemA family protein n=1 Tax=Euryhalocaulis sp. TaxID=2744307 RepID=UPI0003A257FF|nr:MULTISPECIES: LemA family protein [Euryhalocaulis]MBA4802573.1 LemA family protein [Euryhalocaulis sp.]
MTFIWILLAIVVVVAIFGITIYNRLVALRQAVNQAWGDIDVQLKQRYDLIPNLVETVKGYASHERETLEAVTQARQQAIDASSLQDQQQAENLLTGALRQLFAVAEAYPDLKANQNFLELQRELSDVENKIAAARRFFNNSVAELNTAVEQFPAVLFAAPLGFSKKEYFEVDVDDRAKVEAAPDVSF